VFFKFLIPLIALILLKNTGYLFEISEFIFSEYQKDFQLVTCARQDVYRRNIEEAIEYFAGQYDYVASDLAAQDFIEFEEDEESCKNESFAVYREYNPKLPAVYPNWVYRETERGD
jgi:hypothetical protein